LPVLAEQLAPAAHQEGDRGVPNGSRRLHTCEDGFM